MSKALQPDDLIGHYRVIRQLGAGGMGEVYLARDSTLDRDVALKVLPQMAQDDDRIRRFVLEAKSASGLSHPHIITVYEIGCEPVQSADGSRADQVNYIAMELVSGDTLGDIIYENKVDLKTLLTYLAQASDGLAKAHASGIVHRDLKPGNIMVSKDGYAKVLDFGLAKLVEKEPAAADATINVATKQNLTVEGMIVGTIGYMPPEQILGRPVDHRSDIFSFGCILYEAITRQRPFNAPSQFEALQKIIHENPEPIEKFVADAPNELKFLVARCLAKSPDERIPSMKDVATELRRIANTYEVLARSAAGATDQTMFFPSTSGAIPAPSGAAVPLMYQSGAAAAPSGVVQPAAVPVPAKKGLPIIPIAVGLVVLVGGGVGYWKFGGKPAGLSQEAIANMKVTTVLSNEALASTAVSPDGRYAAYASLLNTAWQLHTRQISTGTDAPILKPGSSQVSELSFSPDGDLLWYVAADEEDNQHLSLYQVPSLGNSTPKRVIRDVDTAPTFSPDGKSIAFMRGIPGDKTSKTQLIIHPLEGGQDTTIAEIVSEQEIVIDKPRMSPDGKKIAVISTQTPGHPQILVYDVASKQSQQLGDWKGPTIDSLAWLGNDGLVVAGAPAPGPIQPLWYVPYPGGLRQRLTTDPALYAFVSTSTDGKTVAARRLQRAYDIWSVPVDGEPKAAKPVSTAKDNVNTPGISTDGTLIFTAPQEDSFTVWSMKPGGTRSAIGPKTSVVLQQQLLRGQNASVFTAFGADGVPHIHRVGADGGDAKQLTSGAGETLVAVTPDGKSVVYNTPAAQRTLVVIGSDGSGTPRPLVTDYADRLIISRDGQLISYNRFEAQGQSVTSRVVAGFADGKLIATHASLPPSARNTTQFTPDGAFLTYTHSAQAAKGTAPPTPAALMKVPVKGGTPQKLFDMPDGRLDTHRWVDDQTMVLGVRSTSRPVSNLYRWKVGTPQPVELTNFPTGVIPELYISPETKTVYFTQGSQNRDIIKITGLVK